MASKELTFEDRCKIFEKCATEVGWELPADVKDGKYVITNPIFLRFEIGEAEWVRFSYVAAYNQWFKSGDIQDYAKWLNKKKWKNYALDKKEEILEFADVIQIPNNLYEMFIPELVKDLNDEVNGVLKTARDYIDIMEDD